MYPTFSIGLRSGPIQEWNFVLLKEFLGSLRSMHAAMILLKDEIVSHYVVHNRMGTLMKKLLIKCRCYTSIHLFHKNYSWRKEHSPDHDASTPPWRMFRSSFSFSHFSHPSLSIVGSIQVDFFSPKKVLFASSLFFFLFEIASEQAFLVVRNFSGLFGWCGVLSLHWKP